MGRGPRIRRCKIGSCLASASAESGSDLFAIAFHAGGRSRRRWSPRTTRCCFAWRRGTRSRPSAVPRSCAAVAVGRRARRCWRGAARCVIQRPRRGHVRAAARCRRPPSLTRHAAGVPRRSAAAQQGDALPSRPTHDRGDRHRDAPRRRQRARPPAARPDRRALARRPAHPRGARARRGRPGRASRLAAGAARQGRPPPRGRHGRLGLGAARALAPGARRAAGRTAVLRRQRRHARAALGGRRRPLASCAASPARPACGDASRRTSSATRTPSRWPARACR